MTLAEAVTSARWLALLAIAGCLAVGFALYLLHRGCVWLEQHGYIYYREKRSGSAIGSVLGGVDELTRPSIKHVREAEEESRYETRRKHEGD